MGPPIEADKINWELVATTARAQITDQIATINQLTDRVNAQQVEADQLNKTITELKARNRYLDEHVADLT